MTAGASDGARDSASDGARDSASDGARDLGSMALEMTLLAPLLIAFMVLMVGLGRVVEAQSQTDGAARDAARAASVARDRGGAGIAARQAADATLSTRDWCRGGPNTSVDFSEWGRGGQVSVSVACTVDLVGLSLIGFAPAKTFTGTAAAPLDTLRRVE